MSVGALSREINFRMCRDATPGATTLGTRVMHTARISRLGQTR